MKARSQLRKARTAFWLAGLFALIGLVPVIYFLALAGWQWSASIPAGKWFALPLTLAFTDHAALQAANVAPVLPYIPELPWRATPQIAGLLDRVHVGLIPAILGLLIAALAVGHALRQRALIRALKQDSADRVRRIQDYRREELRIEPVDERREPYIGAGFERNTDRRVA
ncbi:MAG TPA: hypothetical protein VIB01_11645 [Steroidobacteraceae bacterium]|jgi:hypothetical protein